MLDVGVKRRFEPEASPDARDEAPPDTLQDPLVSSDLGSEAPLADPLEVELGVLTTLADDPGVSEVLFDEAEDDASRGDADAIEIMESLAPVPEDAPVNPDALKDHRLANDVLKGTGDGLSGTGDATKEVVKLLGGDGDVANDIGSIGGIGKDLTGGARGINDAIGAVRNPTGAEDDTDTSAAAHTGSRVVGGISSGIGGIGDAAEEVVRLVDDPVVGTDADGEDKTLSSDIGTATSAARSLVGIPKSVLDAIAKFHKVDASDSKKMAAIVEGMRNSGKGLTDGIASILSIMGLHDPSSDVKTGGDAANDLLGMPLDVLSRVDRIGDSEEPLDERLEAGKDIGKDLGAHGLSGARHIASLLGEDGVADDIGDALNGHGAGFGLLDGAFGIHDGIEKIQQGKRTKDDWTTAQGGVEVAGHSGTIAKAGIDIADLASGGSVGELATASKVTGGLAGGVLGGAAAMIKGKDAYRSIQAARKLEKGTGVGQAIEGQGDSRKRLLADRWGIDTGEEGWKSSFEQRFASSQKAASGSEEAHAAFHGDTDVKSLHQAEQLGDVRKYAHVRKGVKAALDTTSATGGVLQAVGSGTAALDGGITKTVGDVMVVLPQVARIGDKLADRGIAASRQVEAEDMMRGYAKEGVFGKAGEAVGRSPVGRGAKAVGSGVRAVGGMIGRGAAAVGNEVVSGGKRAGAAIKSAGESFFGWAKKKARRLKGVVSEAASTAASGIKQAAKSVGTAIAEGPVGTAANNVGSAVGHVAERVRTGTVGRAVGRGVDAVKDSGFGEAVGSGFKKVFGGTDEQGRHERGAIERGANQLTGFEDEEGVQHESVLKTGARSAWNAVKAAGRAVKDGAVAAGGAVREHVLDPVAGGVAAASRSVYDNALAPVGGAVSKGAGALYDHALAPAGRAVARGAEAVYDNALAPAGRVVGAPFAAAGGWMKENVWETSDMKWARKAGKMVSGPNVDATREQWEAAKQDPASEAGGHLAAAKEDDFASFTQAEAGLEAGDNRTLHARRLAKMVMGGDDVEPATHVNARWLLDEMDVAGPQSKWNGPLAKLRALGAMGLDAKGISPVPKALKDAEKDHSVRGPEGQTLPPEAMRAEATRRRAEVKRKQQKELAGRIAGSFGI